METSNQFNPRCVCGGSTENPNADCERCQMLAELARLKSDKEAAERERDEAKERVNVIQEAYDRDTAKLQQEIQRLSAANSGVYWRWQGDGGDYLESLTCPILIDVGQLKDIFDKGAAWHDALTLCRIELAYLIEQLPLRGLGVSSVQSAYDAATAALLPPAKEVEGG